MAFSQAVVAEHYDTGASCLLFQMFINLIGIYVFYLKCVF